MAQRAVNKSEVSRKTGISKARITELSIKERSRLQAGELYLVALAIGVNPCEMKNSLCGHLKLKPQ